MKDSPRETRKAIAGKIAFSGGKGDIVLIAFIVLLLRLIRDGKSIVFGQFVKPRV